MSDPTKTTSDAMVAATTALAKESYTDLAKPAASELGKVLGTGASIVRLIFRPVTTLVTTAHELWDRLDDRLRKRLEREPPEEIAEPSPVVSGPLLLSYPFIEGEAELRDLFEELLAKAMLRNSRAFVHPAFVEILKQLSLDEARLLPFLATQQYHAGIRIKFSPDPPVELPKNTAPPGQRPTVSPYAPFHALQQAQKRGFVGSVIVTDWTDHVALDGSDVDSVERAINNLVRLGIIEVRDGHLQDQSAYEKVRASKSWVEAEQFAKDRQLYMDTDRQILEIVPFGMQLLKICLP